MPTISFLTVTEILTSFLFVLVVTARLSPIAKAYHIDKTVVLFGMTTLVLAIEVNRVLNGFTRPFWGWVSDHIGRENTMFIAFLLEGVSVLALMRLVSHPVWFIVMTGMADIHRPGAVL